MLRVRTKWKAASVRGNCQPHPAKERQISKSTKPGESRALGFVLILCPDATAPTSPFVWEKFLLLWSPKDAPHPHPRTAIPVAIHVQFCPGVWCNLLWSRQGRTGSLSPSRPVFLGMFVVVFLCWSLTGSRSVQPLMDHLCIVLEWLIVFKSIWYS